MLYRLRMSLLDCFRYREVLYNILSQDLKVKYKRTFLGYVWSLLNPVLQLAVLSLVFSHLVRLGMKDYTLYLFSGLLVWTFISSALLSSSSALLENEGFIKKVYLPKLLFPLSRVCLRAVDFLFSLVALTLIGWMMGFQLHATFALVPFAIVILMFFTLGIALLVSLATVYFRDVQYLLNVFLQLMYFATPIIYPIQALPEKYQPYMALNPFVPQLRLFQKLIYFGEVPSAVDWLSALGIALLALVSGIWMLLLLDEDVVFRM